MPRKERKLAANVVAAHYMSVTNGSFKRFDAHQNWFLGLCGILQPGANDVLYLIESIFGVEHDKKPMTSHAICPHIYVSSFEHSFYAVDNYCLVSSKDAPSDFRMGYNEPRKNYEGNFASPTYQNEPYNAPTAVDISFSTLLPTIIELFQNLLLFLAKLISFLF